MRHWNITLLRDERPARSWAVWSDHLTIGSQPGCAIFLPPPFPAVAAEFHDDGTFLVDPGSLSEHGGRLDRSEQRVRVALDDGATLEVVDDTARQQALWQVALRRMDSAAKARWHEPGHSRHRLIAQVLFLAAALGIATRTILAPEAPADLAPPPIEELVIDIPVPDEPPPPPPPEPEPELDPAGAIPLPSPDPVPGGPTEITTVLRDPDVSQVMEGSVISQLQDLDETIIGDDIDPEDTKATDVILAQASKGKLVRGPGGQDGTRDRMHPPSGWGGPGHAGRIGMGPGGGWHQGDLSVGPGGPGRRPTAGPRAEAKARNTPPKPSDITLPDGEGGLRSPESILRVIRNHIGGFRYSYNKYLKANPNLGGKISFRFTIAPTGDIVSATIVETNTSEPALDDEIRDKVRRMRFDAIDKGNVTVTYAFVLDKQ